MGINGDNRMAFRFTYAIEGSICKLSRKSISSYTLRVLLHNSPIAALIINIINIIRYELGLERPVLVSSNSPFKGLPRRVCPFGLKFSIILATCCCPFLLHVAANLIFIFLGSR